MFLHLLSDEQRRQFAAAAELVAGLPADGRADQADVARALPDPALYGSVVARNVFLLELTRVVMADGRSGGDAEDFLARCVAALDVPGDRFDRFKSFASPPARVTQQAHAAA